MGPSPEGAMLLNATAAAFASRIPTRLRRFTPTVLALMMDKPQVAVALGLKPAPAALCVPFSAVLRFRALKARRRHLPTEPIFVPDGRMSAYPDGYSLDQIDQIGQQATV